MPLYSGVHGLPLIVDSNPPMPHCNDHIGILYDQVRQVTRLIADAAHRNVPPSWRKRRLMEGLKYLIDADGWLWSTRFYALGEDRPAHRNILHDGLNGAQLGGWINGCRDQSDGPPEEGPLATLATLDAHFTRTRRELVPDDAWYGHPFVRRCRLDKGIDHFLCSFYPLASRHYSVITLFRATGQQPFSQTDRRLCHLVVEATESFHHAVFETHQPRNWTGSTPSTAKRSHLSPPRPIA